MTPSHFLDFTLGNLISIGVFIAGAAAVWQKMKDAIKVMETRLGKQELEMQELSKLGLLVTVAQHDRRLNAIEATVAEIGAMKRDIEWIRAALNQRKEEAEQ